ncbi:dTDP-4-dehydrorhamnose reductase [Denitromonas ohlonensis]|uniref:dTDP-4-dehydrorhamnose reductase n=2 Tax=Denitromonas TaxID=139331 RepID=A0A557RSJ1_9RHOO|nr:dTDP-4-dehydrorhamnose reductase [Denitromonas ohlonensis]TVO68116.1 dTDP-4-dehydrorhamnose reductase [Denitromonas ohlonensis]TVO77979.1 dTDP-4-dehydrorhamnose reductase [Denitromonas ohlonensis]
MKLLVTGATGQVGWELARSLMPLGEVVALDRAACDLSDPQAAAAVVAGYAPDVIVNAAAYTAVDKAESESELAHRINAEAVGALADTARELGALLVHYSTDYVFDGRQATPYTETDATAPLNVYGASKLAGEAAIAASGCDHLILRTTWVYAARGQNFVATMLRLFAEREALRVVGDQHGAPTWARNIADATAGLICWAQTATAAGDPVQRTFNLSAAGETTWHGFAEEIHRLAVQRWPDHPWKLREIESIPTSAYPTPAARPHNSRLDSARLAEETRIVMPHWRDALLRCLEERIAP